VSLLSLLIPERVTASASLTTEILSIKNNYFIVKEGEKYHYHKITVVDIDTPAAFFRLEKHPPVFCDGIVVIKKKLYRLPMADILRGVVRKSREITLKVTSDESKSRRSAGKPIGTNDIVVLTGNEAFQHPNESAVSDDFEDEVSQQADVYWEEQVDSLLHSIYTEEGGEWEISNPTQSGPAHEGSAIQDSH
jgi:hypothetical protein